MPASYLNRPEAQKKKIAELQEIAISRGGKFLSTEYISSKTRYDWQCSQGHIWPSSAGSVKGQETWCPTCAGHAPRTLDQLKQIVESRGGVLLSKQYVNVDAKYEFRCNLGHLNSNSFKKIEAGQWCSTCNKTSKSEEITRAILQNLFELPFPKQRPKWLRNSRDRQMELDGYCKDLEIAFEYQGVQHFKDVSMYKGDLSQRIADDKLKAKLCRLNGVKLLIFTYLDDFGSFHKIAEKQLSNWPGIGSVNFRKAVSFDDAFIRDDRLIELRNLLALKEIEVLSKKWLKVDTLYSFRCLVCMTQWKNKASAYLNSRRVAGCDYCNRRTPANKKNMEFLVEFARANGGRVLSSEYVGRRAHYDFVCSKNHKFNGNLNNLIERNQFCSECEGRDVRTPMPSLKELEETLLQLNLRLLSRPTKRSDSTTVACTRCGKKKTAQLRAVLAAAQSCSSCDSHPNAGKLGPRKLSDKQEAKIVASLLAGETTSALSQKYGVSTTTIRNIRARG